MINLHIINRIKFYLKKNKLHSMGKNTVFSGDILLKNPDCIIFGEECKIGPGCRIEAWNKYGDDKFNPSIVFGNDVRVNSKCHIGAINSIKIGNNTLIGSNVIIIDHSHGKNDYGEMSIHPSDRRLYSKGPISIGDYCWICENVCILPNVSIGDHCTIGANAVVTKDIPPYSVAVGNPARVVKRIIRDEG